MFLVLVSLARCWCAGLALWDMGFLFGRFDEGGGGVSVEVGFLVNPNTTKKVTVSLSQKSARRYLERPR